MLIARKSTSARNSNRADSPRLRDDFGRSRRNENRKRKKEELLTSVQHSPCLVRQLSVHNTDSNLDGVSRVAGMPEGREAVTQVQPYSCFIVLMVVASYESYGVVYNGEIAKDHIGVSRLDDL